MIANNTYKVVKDLGKGGFAKVSLVQHVHTNQPFACKIIPKIRNDNGLGQSSESIKKEICILQKLKGREEIAQLQEVIEDAEHVYLFLEYCRGGDLQEYMRQARHKHGHEPYLRTIAKRMLQLVAICHENDVIHNDIKMSNFVFAEKPGYVPSLKLIDFGTSIIGSPSDPNKRAPFGAATPIYTAPESLSSRTCQKSDVWSVGVVTYYLLSGKFPFNDRHHPGDPCTYRIWHSILTDQLHFASKYWCLISDEAKDFVTQLLSKDKALRPTALEALAHPWVANNKITIH